LLLLLLLRPLSLLLSRTLLQHHPVLAHANHVGSGTLLVAFVRRAVDEERSELGTRLQLYEEAALVPLRDL
ncbi:hypothetical protein PFISCL1PPCAC_8599, partial [Pristionchus fissidentatus]